MKAAKSLARFSVVLGALIAVPLLPGGVSASAACASQLGVPVSGDLAGVTCQADGRVSRGGVSVELPRPGAGVSAAAITTSGPIELLVTRRLDGSVVVSADHNEATGAASRIATESAISAGNSLLAAAAQPSSTNPCVDTGYAISSFKLGGIFNWYYNGAGAPGPVATTAAGAISNATMDMSRGTNRCGYPANIKATSRYVGPSHWAPQVGVSGACAGNPDSISVAGWKALSGGYLAYTCTYFSGSTVTTSDVAISTRFAWYTTAATPRTCRGSYDLRSVMLHERGHTYGIGHVDQSAHSPEVMTPSLSPCTITKRALARGDYTALVQKYGQS